MNVEQLHSCQERASAKDRRRLELGYETFKTCTVDDLHKLGAPELRARRMLLVDGIAAMQSLDDLGAEANEIAWRTLVELERRLKVMDERK